MNSRNLLKLMVMGDGTNFQIPKTSVDDQVRPGLNANQQTRGESAVLSWSHAASPNTMLTTSLYQRWSSMSFDQTGEPLASIAQNSRTLWTIGIKSDLTMLLKRHTIKGGIDLVRLRPEESLFFYGEGYVALTHSLGLPHAHLRGPNRGPITFNGEEAGGQGSIYVQDSFELTHKLRTQVGLRFDRYSLETSASHFSPRVSASYRLSERGTTLHAAYDHFFVPPAVENVLISSAGLTRYVQGFDQPLPPLQPIVENQVELGITQPLHRNFRVSATGYYRQSKEPVHTVLFPDTRIYAYANFDKVKAYGLELKADVPIVARLGISAYVNYAVSRVYFWNPITAGFVAEDHHFGNNERFLAPMDQTHSLNGGVTYRNRRGFFVSTTFEYGSGTPLEEAHEDETSGAPLRVPGHYAQDVSVGVDLLRSQDKPRLSLQFNVENVTDNVYVISQESTFSPGAYYHPRFYSGALKIHF
jgi:outer membrane receptor protein involved in Fe transport